jgi:hypothetical protein
MFNLVIEAKICLSLIAFKLILKDVFDWLLLNWQLIRLIVKLSNVRLFSDTFLSNFAVPIGFIFATVISRDVLHDEKPITIVRKT